MTNLKPKNIKKIEDSFISCLNHIHQDDPVYEDGTRLSDSDIAAHAKQNMLDPDWCDDFINYETTPSSKKRWENLLESIL